MPIKLLLKIVGPKGRKQLKNGPRCTDLKFYPRVLTAMDVNRMEQNSFIVKIVISGNAAYPRG
jgi:hypothetical protein